MPLATLIVDDTGTELAFLDSGAPSTAPYTTIFAIHGMCFAAPIFRKVQALASAQGTRFVALNRRGYPGSSAFTQHELDVLQDGDEARKHAWLAARGAEVLAFVDAFMQKYSLPRLAADGKRGGVALLGWSMGVAYCLAALASADTLPAALRARVCPQVRALILHEPSHMALGLTPPPQHQFHLRDATLTADEQWAHLAASLTAYWDHRDLSARNLDALSWAEPSTTRAATITRISAADAQGLVCPPALGPDGAFLGALQVQLRASYQKALFDPATGGVFPSMRVAYLVGARSGAYAPATMWAVQDDEGGARGGRVIRYRVMQGVNHFVSAVGRSRRNGPVLSAELERMSRLVSFL